MRRTSPLRQFLAALLATLLVALAVIAFTRPGHIVTAQFANAAGLFPGNDVRVHGVVAGSVKDVSINVDPSTGTQFAVARLNIDDAYWPLHQGTRIAVKPKGVLANVYVDIDPGGTGGPALPSGYTFSVAQTQSPINLDGLTNVFTYDVRQAIRTQIQQGVIALGGGGVPALQTTLDNAAPLFQDAVPVTDVLAQDSPQLDRLNLEADQVTHMLASEDQHLRGVIHNTDVTLAALAAQQTNLQGTLDNASSSLGEIDGVLRGEENNLQAIFTRGPQALSLTQQNAEALLPLIEAINPHVSSLDQLLYEFVTATGFNLGTSGGIDTLRVDGSLPPSNRGSAPCGGQPSEQSC